MILCNFMNKMTLTYLIALGIIAVLSIASYVTLKKDISSQETNAAVINLTSKQRFLTQNIAIHSLCLASTNDSAETEALRQYRLTTIHTIETVHKGSLAETHPFICPEGNPRRSTLCILNHRCSYTQEARNL
ncbi:MAG: hypothetical protein BROFUL_01484 [Candidatus Brocadia fulgida]|uniref:Uncharacterized protein n=1 Tax=Candidatus Brocadia fulgida TaxID=380242 RepID=A0A0M2UUT0_9BACT|nr:MAG: hypothetical protein BROFUL_01484 [Candidatus Brocadia fulgida]